LQQKAISDAEAASRPDEVEILTSQSSFVEKFKAFLPTSFSVLALSEMVKFIARMQNARRGPAAQGQLKKISLDYTAEGYSNFMAAGRMDWIAGQVERLPEHDQNKDIFTPEVLKPASDIYLTPSWDEMVPFPMTWKLKFDGFGASDYSTNEHPYGKLTPPFVPDDSPPWYQPQGPSHVGGSFAEVTCICAKPDSPCRCLQQATDATRQDERLPRRQHPAELEPTLSKGCSLSGHAPQQ
jgi:hypothetical protein